MISALWNFFTKSRHQREYECLQGALSELDVFDLDDLTRSLGIINGNAVVHQRAIATTAEFNKKNIETSSVRNDEVLVQL
ncbi:hypothetical protein B566_EDAN012862 [Ephemera danica]|nr:hypothetical protein B566_EDAN012862 [Ephemera danica]